MSQCFFCQNEADIEADIKITAKNTAGERIIEQLGSDRQIMGLCTVCQNRVNFIEALDEMRDTPRIQ